MDENENAEKHKDIFQTHNRRFSFILGRTYLLCFETWII